MVLSHVSERDRVASDVRRVADGHVRDEADAAALCWQRSLLERERGQGIGGSVLTVSEDAREGVALAAIDRH